MSIDTSVVIPTFNRWPVICRAIDSVLQQSVPVTEILIVDDGSTDDTESKLAQKYAAHNNLRIIHRPNGGVSAARNTGFKEARGQWIALLDSDDEWLPNKLERQHAAAKAQPGCMLIHTDEIWIRNGVKVNPMNKHQKRGGHIYEHCLPLCAISPSSVLFRAELLNIVGYFDESLPACEDYDMWLRICAGYPVHYVDEKLLKKYGGHADQLSRKYWGMDRYRIIALQKMLDSNDLSEEYFRSTQAMLKEKTNILLTGAIKHNNHALIDECKSVLHRYHLMDEPRNPTVDQERCP